MITIVYFLEQEQETLQAGSGPTPHDLSTVETQPAAKEKPVRLCRTCKKPMKSHRKGQCDIDSENN